MEPSPSGGLQTTEPALHRKERQCFRTGRMALLGARKPAFPLQSYQPPAVVAADCCAAWTCRGPRRPPLRAEKKRHLDPRGKQSLPFLGVLLSAAVFPNLRTAISETEKKGAGLEARKTCFLGTVSEQEKPAYHGRAAVSLTPRGRPSWRGPGKPAGLCEGVPGDERQCFREERWQHRKERRCSRDERWQDPKERRCSRDERWQHRKERRCSRDERHFFKSAPRLSAAMDGRAAAPR